MPSVEDLLGILDEEGDDGLLEFNRIGPKALAELKEKLQEWQEEK